MNKGTKIILILMIVMIFVYVVSGVYSKYFSTNDSKTNNNTQDEKEKYTYQLTSGDNDIILVAHSKDETTTFKYLFDESGDVYRIEIVEECASDDDAKKYYDGIKETSDISNIYSNIELENNTVTMILKQDYVDYHKQFSKEEIYKMQEDTIAASDKESL